MSWVDDNLLGPRETVLYRTRARGRDELVVTSRRVIYVDQGIFGRDVSEINLTNLESVQVKQSLMGRVFNTGNVLIGSGSGNRDIQITGVRNPLEFRRQAYDACDAL